MHIRPLGRQVFCTTQVLSMLTERSDVRQHLSGEQFWRDRQPNRLDTDNSPDSPWEATPRETLANGLAAGGEGKRLAVVCAGGLGKSANLRWLAGRFAAEGSRQVPFFFSLDESGLPVDAKTLLEHTLPARVREAKEGPLDERRLRETLDRLRTAGRITLLLDGIDQATAVGLGLVRSLLASAGWEGCPIVLSGRPHAVFDLWDELIGDRETQWRFARVEPLAEADRRLLLDHDGVRRYDTLPPGGRELVGNPRNIEYVLKCEVPEGPPTGREPEEVSVFTLYDLRTASHVFAGAAEHMVRHGMNNERARKLGRPKDRPAPEHPSSTQVEFALNLLGALAYSMYCFPIPGPQKAGKKTRRDEDAGPNVSHVPGRLMTMFKNEVLRRMKASGMLGESDYDEDFRYGPADLTDDLDALAELNAEIKFDLLDTRPQRHGDFRWYDRTLQEFFAARWLARYAGRDDRDRLRRWRYGSLDETAESLYRPLWGFLVEMPRAVRRNRSWVPAAGALFASPARRCSEMIFRSWPILSKSVRGRKILGRWRRGYRRLLETPGPQGDAARGIRDGFRPCPKNPADAGKPFLMGSPAEEQDRSDDETQHPVTLSPFRMHRHPVTNAQYELFDPDHENHRGDIGSPDHPAREEAADHPVVNVTWFDAWCFARWTKNHLPTEARWEYSCRGGPVSYQVFHYGDSLSSLQANFNGKYPYGEANEGPSRRCTTRVGTFAPNAFGLYDMHGNVWEWCADGYDEDFYESEAATLRDPVNDRGAPFRVLRGGSWFDRGRYCRSAYRFRDTPTPRYQFIGFRLAAAPTGTEVP
jgi:formylglycine-generating enzyme required for sulfatase activity